MIISMEPIAQLWAVSLDKPRIVLIGVRIIIMASLNIIPLIRKEEADGNSLLRSFRTRGRK